MTQTKFQRIERSDPTVVDSGIVFELIDWHHLTRTQVEAASNDVVNWCQQMCKENSWKVSLSEFSCQEPDASYGAGNYSMVVWGDGGQLSVSFNAEGDASLFALTWC